MNTAIPAIHPSRMRPANDRQVAGGGRFVLYWMVAQRRPHWNHAVQRALWWAEELGRPLLVLEPLSCCYPFASDRLHRFILDGMRQNAELFGLAGVTYYPYVEPRPGAGSGLLEALAREACVVVTDDWPAFITPRLVAAAARHVPIRLEQIDSCGLVPLSFGERPFERAHAFRRFVQKRLGEALPTAPIEDPLERAPRLPPLAIPGSIKRRWPAAPRALLESRPGSLSDLSIDHDVPVVTTRGGWQIARERLALFVERILPHYAENRDHPDADGTSRLSAYLHFGHISSFEIFDAVMRSVGWTPVKLPDLAEGKREGWWGIPAAFEGFLDQLVTWRELGFHYCRHQPRHKEWESLPPWARATLTEHSGDPRPHIYSLEQLESSETHDSLWNAAQRELAREGRIHNSLRMLWGKKILEWSPSPRQALEVMIHLNDRWAIDGRDPNSYTGISWVLGRHDRAWGPERPIYGKVRYMSSTNQARKLRVKRYLERFAR